MFVDEAGELTGAARLFLNCLANEFLNYPAGVIHALVAITLALSFSVYNVLSQSIPHLFLTGAQRDN